MLRTHMHDVTLFILFVCVKLFAGRDTRRFSCCCIPWPTAPVTPWPPRHHIWPVVPPIPHSFYPDIPFTTLLRNLRARSHPLRISWGQSLAALGVPRREQPRSWEWPEWAPVRRVSNAEVNPFCNSELACCSDCVEGEGASRSSDWQTPFPLSCLSCTH
jgi:hypothetical protein